MNRATMGLRPRGGHAQVFDCYFAPNNWCAAARPAQRPALAHPCAAPGGCDGAVGRVAAAPRSTYTNPNAACVDTREAASGFQGICVNSNPYFCPLDGACTRQPTRRLHYCARRTGRKHGPLDAYVRH